MEGGASSPRYLGSPGHQVAREQTQDAGNLGTALSVGFKRSLQCQRAVKGSWFTLPLLEGSVRSRKPNVPLALFKAFIRLHLEYCIWQEIAKCHKRLIVFCRFEERVERQTSH